MSISIKPPVNPAVNQPETTAASKRSFSVFASVKLTVLTLSLIAATVLLGAWCPQEAQVGQEKVLDQFGPEWGMRLVQWGISDIFHSLWFLFLIGLLTLNMVACSVQRVFPKVRLLRQPMPWLGQREISRMPYNDSFSFSRSASSDPSSDPSWDSSSGSLVSQAISLLKPELKRRGYIVRQQDNKVVAEFGKFGRLAATITHIGLLTLLVGVTITSWTGFSGFKPVRPGEALAFADSEHSKLWIGKLPDWKVRVDQTRREDYKTGEAKQWYSDLTVVDAQGKEITKQQISVNNPLSYGGTDVYQSSWGMDQLIISFNGHQKTLQLRPMGKLYAAFLPLDQTTILIFSVKDQTKPLRLFAKTPQWPQPKLLAEIAPSKQVTLGSVAVKYEKAVPVTGLQYKCDPGLPLTYVAFGFIITGVLLASVPHRQVWAAVEAVEADAPSFAPQQWRLVLGGRSVKARVGFERSMKRIMDSLKTRLEDKTITQGAPLAVAAGDERPMALAAKGEG